MDPKYAGVMAQRFLNQIPTLLATTMLSQATHGSEYTGARDSRDLLDIAAHRHSSTETPW